MLKTAQRKHRIENSSRGEWQQVGDRMGEGKKRTVFQSYTSLFQCLPWGKGLRSEEGQPHSAESSMLEGDRGVCNLDTRVPARKQAARWEIIQRSEGDKFSLSTLICPSTSKL